MQISFTITIEYLCLKNLLLGCSTLKPQMVETSWWFCFCHMYSPVKLYALDSSTVAVGFHFRLRRKVLGIRCGRGCENRKQKKVWTEGMIQWYILGGSVRYQGDGSVGKRGRHQATAGLVVFARGPKPWVVHLPSCTSCMFGTRNLHRTNAGCQRVGRKDGGRGRKWE